MEISGILLLIILDLQVTQDTLLVLKSNVRVFSQGVP